MCIYRVLAILLCQILGSILMILQCTLQLSDNWLFWANETHFRIDRLSFQSQSYADTVSSCSRHYAFRKWREFIRKRSWLRGKTLNFRSPDPFIDERSLQLQAKNYTLQHINLIQFCQNFLMSILRWLNWLVLIIRMPQNFMTNWGHPRSLYIFR